VGLSGGAFVEKDVHDKDYTYLCSGRIYSSDTTLLKSHFWGTNHSPSLTFNFL